MAVIELDLGGGLKLANFLKAGYTGYFDGKAFRVFEGDKLVESFSDAQGKILNQLIEKKAMTPKQISDVVGSTPAGVIYNLKHLMKTGVVKRYPLPGGTVFYILCWDVKIDLSPAIKSKIDSEVAALGGWGQLSKMPMRDLKSVFSKLSQEEFLEVMRYLVGMTSTAG